MLHDCWDTLEKRTIHVGFRTQLARRRRRNLGFSWRYQMNAVMQLPGQADGWSRRRAKKAARLARLAPWMKGPVLETGAIVEALEALIEPGDAVALEGDNQKQADFLSRWLVRVDPR